MCQPDGFDSVPLMFHEFVEVRAWMDGQMFLNGIALGQITPGPIVITATFLVTVSVYPAGPESDLGIAH